MTDDSLKGRRGGGFKHIATPSGPVCRLNMTWHQAAEFIWQNDGQLNDEMPFRMHLIVAAAEMGYDVCIPDTFPGEGGWDIRLSRGGEEEHYFSGGNGISLAHRFLRTELAYNAILYPFECIPWSPEGLCALCLRRGELA